MPECPGDRRPRSDTRTHRRHRQHQQDSGQDLPHGRTRGDGPHVGDSGAFVSQFGIPPVAASGTAPRGRYPESADNRPTPELTEPPPPRAFSWPRQRRAAEGRQRLTHARPSQAAHRQPPTYQPHEREEEDDRQALHQGHPLGLGAPGHTVGKDGGGWPHIG